MSDTAAVKCKTIHLPWGTDFSGIVTQLAIRFDRVTVTVENYGMTSQCHLIRAWNEAP